MSLFLFYILCCLCASNGVCSGTFAYYDGENPNEKNKLKWITDDISHHTSPVYPVQSCFGGVTVYHPGTIHTKCCQFNSIDRPSRPRIVTPLYLRVWHRILCFIWSIRCCVSSYAISVMPSVVCNQRTLHTFFSIFMESDKPATILATVNNHCHFLVLPRANLNIVYMMLWSALPSGVHSHLCCDVCCGQQCINNVFDRELREYCGHVLTRDASPRLFA